MTVEQFVEQYGQRVKATKNGWVMCCLYPEHQDNTPSFSVNKDGLFLCWGCHKKGNFARLLHDIAGWSWKKSIEYSGEGDEKVLQAPITLPDFDDRFKDDDPSLSMANLAFYEVDWEKALLRARRIDASGAEMPLWAWPFQRGFKPRTLNRFQVGFDAEKGRLTIPVFSRSWGMKHRELIGFIGRSCSEHITPKYVVYPPLPTGEYVYNLDNLTSRVPYIVIVEGAADVWYLHQTCKRFSVALMTSHISESQANQLLSISTEFTILFDNDPAGQKGAVDVAKTLISKGAEVSIVLEYPSGVTNMKNLTRHQLDRMFKRRVSYPIPFLMQERSSWAK